jgi:hypothetical protein
MRTLDRLLAVMEAVNWEVWPYASIELHQAACELRNGLVSTMGLASMRALADNHPSPHIRELALEAVQYMLQVLNRRAA